MLISYVVIAMVCPMVLVVVKPKKLFLRSVLLWVVKVNFLNLSIMLKVLLSFQLIYLLLRFSHLLLRFSHLLLRFYHLLLKGVNCIPYCSLYQLCQIIFCSVCSCHFLLALSPMGAGVLKLCASGFLSPMSTYVTFSELCCEDCFWATGVV